MQFIFPEILRKLIFKTYPSLEMLETHLRSCNIQNKYIYYPHYLSLTRLILIEVKKLIISIKRHLSNSSTAYNKSIAAIGADILNLICSSTFNFSSSLTNKANHKFLHQQTIKLSSSSKQTERYFTTFSNTCPLATIF